MRYIISLIKVTELKFVRSVDMDNVVMFTITIRYDDRDLDALSRHIVLYLRKTAGTLS